MLILVPAGKVTLLSSIVMQGHRYGAGSAAERACRERIPLHIAVALLRGCPSKPTKQGSQS